MRQRGEELTLQCSNASALKFKKVLQWIVRAEQCSGVVGGGGETKGRRQADHLD